MPETIQLLLVAGVFVIPFLLRFLDNQARRKDRAEDRRDREEVAKRAEDAATKVETVTTDLITSNREVADAAVEAARINNDKLDILDKGQKVIHTLVNSSLTGAIEGQLAALIAQAVVMREMIALRGPAVQPAALAAVEAVEAKVTELQGALADRKKSQDEVDAGKTT